MNDDRLRNSRRFLVLGLYLLVALWGVAQVRLLQLYLPSALAIAAIATCWAVLDARRNGAPVLHIVQFLMFFTWPVALPIYLIWSRGARGLDLALFHALGLTAVLVVAFDATLLIAAP
jgi:hypothetical protein